MDGAGFLEGWVHENENEEGIIIRMRFRWAFGRVMHFAGKSIFFLSG